MTIGDDQGTALRDRILRILLDRLRASESSLTADPEVSEQLAAQVDWILDRTVDRLGRPDGMARFSAPPRHGSGVGETRARQNIHPVDSLIAATELFDVALSCISADPDIDVDVGELARALNASIMSAVVPASVGYVNVLLERLAVAHSEERLSISRELHDRVAHSIAAGLQRVELGGMAIDANPQLREGLDLFGAALDETRAIALDLRHAVGEKMLDEAIRDYVDDLDDSGPPVVTTVVGTPYRLSTGVQEEAFIIIREAVHNARRHSHAEKIRVHSHWDRRSLTIAVIDNGRGFAHETVRSGALGLVIAQERAELIGADLDIVPGLGTGTTLSLTIPRGTPNP
ncbi:two-component sensor histidine kinase [Leifsonia sp. LS1]|uniref:sensor histidine kinase n=1 Tax=unclassified Leifsonia TaxID=2663824 RepID=UPI001CBE6E28|nr:MULTISPECIES: ATP-binding protein [unclassified Leifsonia]UAJ79871.1 sensor histidine kinase [Leifsonia sp. ZF2019]GIT81238.1 two-component sensor histidine kinase [Leifsonia sp. LS1]